MVYFHLVFFYRSVGLLCYVFYYVVRGHISPFRHLYNVKDCLTFHVDIWEPEFFSQEWDGEVFNQSIDFANHIGG